MNTIKTKIIFYYSTFAIIYFNTNSVTTNTQQIRDAFWQIFRKGSPLVVSKMLYQMLAFFPYNISESVRTNRIITCQDPRRNFPKAHLDQHTKTQAFRYLAV